MPYLMLAEAERFFPFTAAVFGAESTMTHLHDNGKIMHAELMISGSTIMYCNATDEWKAAPAHLFVYVPNADEAYHKAIELGATSLMELADKDYGRTCGIVDPCGNTWWITTVN